MADEEKKIGCYVCSGCGIGDAVDVDALVSLATDDCDADVAKSHEFLCGKEGVELIRKDIADEGLNSLVIAACSPRANEERGRVVAVVGVRPAITSTVTFAATTGARICACWAISTTIRSGRLSRTWTSMPG